MLLLFLSSLQKGREGKGISILWHHINEVISLHQPPFLELMGTLRAVSCYPSVRQALDRKEAYECQ